MLKKKWLILLYFSLLFLPFVSAYDLNISVESNSTFNFDVSNTYKLVVMNSETADEYINFSLEYSIKKNSGFVSGFPKTTSGELKIQKTISRSWTPKDYGEFEICCRIINSTIADSNPSNDVSCRNIIVPGGESGSQQDTNTSSSDNPSIPEENTGSVSENPSANDSQPEPETQGKAITNIQNESSTSSNQNILKEGNASKTDKTGAEQQKNNITPGITGNVIYESKNEKLKTLSIEILALLLIALIIFNIIKSNGHHA